MKKVLIVDDTKNIRMLLSTCLQIEGYDVTTANTGQEALDLIGCKGFDLIFLDIKMPEISGTEVLKKIRALNLDTPVVIMTAFATVKNAVDCTRLGAISYLQKPFTTEKVRSLLKHLEGIADQSQDIQYYIITGKEMIESGNIEYAYEILKKALSMNPSCTEIYHLIGKIHEINGDLHKAEQFYNAGRQFED